MSVKNLSLRLLLILLTAMENVSQNALLEYVMMNSVFESVMKVGVALDSGCGVECVTLISVSEVQKARKQPNSGLITTLLIVCWYVCVCVGVDSVASRGS